MKTQLPCDLYSLQPFNSCFTANTAIDTAAPATEQCYREKFPEFLSSMLSHYTLPYFLGPHVKMIKPGFSWLTKFTICTVMQTSSAKIRILFVIWSRLVIPSALLLGTSGTNFQLLSPVPGPKSLFPFVFGNCIPPSGEAEEQRQPEM